MLELGEAFATEHVSPQATGNTPGRRRHQARRDQVYNVYPAKRVSSRAASNMPGSRRVLEPGETFAAERISPRATGNTPGRGRGLGRKPETSGSPRPGARCVATPPSASDHETRAIRRAQLPGARGGRWDDGMMEYPSTLTSSGGHIPYIWNM